MDKMRMIRYSAGLASLSLLAVVVGLLLASAVVPLVMGWDRVVVTSGSMEPGIVAGDVVLISADIEDPVEIGTVLVFPDPNRKDGLLTHRVVEVLPEGYRTRGDANPTADTAIVTPDSVVGRGMALVPAIGTPTAWLHQGHPERTAAALVALGLLVWLSRYGLLREFDPWLASGAERSASSDTDARERKGGRGAATALSALAAAVLLVTGAAAGMVGPRLSGAAFTAHTSNSANAFKVPCASRTVIASADTYVDQDAVTTPWGSSTALRVMSHAKDQRALLRFPVSAIPSGCTIATATLRVFSTSSVAGRTIQAVQVTGSWNEASTTWNNQPATAGPAAASTSGLGWREWTVTQQTLAMLSSGNVNLQLRDSVEEAGTDQSQVYSSREGANAPQLVLTMH